MKEEEIKDNEKGGRPRVREREEERGGGGGGRKKRLRKSAHICFFAVPNDRAWEPRQLGSTLRNIRAVM